MKNMNNSVFIETVMATVHACKDVQIWSVVKDIYHSLRISDSTCICVFMRHDFYGVYFSAYFDR